MEKLPKEFKEKWIAALRSGEYEQGKTMLHNAGTFCCLGVACIISGYSVKDMADACYPYTCTVPNVPKMIVGAAHQNKVVQQLAQMNDGEGDFMGHRKTFPEIADWIEANL